MPNSTYAAGTYSSGTYGGTVTAPSDPVLFGPMQVTITEDVMTATVEE